jgi:hypothetical protein
MISQYMWINNGIIKSAQLAVLSSALRVIYAMNVGNVYNKQLLNEVLCAFYCKDLLQFVCNLKYDLWQNRVHSLMLPQFLEE